MPSNMTGYTGKHESSLHVRGHLPGLESVQQARIQSERQEPGGGVGTWSDSSAEWNGQWSDHWDNSGSVRPDMAAKGQTDRGPGELSDALKPTKVKGQFSPGGQMPSITLKGVSIKGQSKVAYEAAAAAAQSEAQAALSQEKVPRAYQGAVRDYFDDTKKRRLRVAGCRLKVASLGCSLPFGFFSGN